MFARLTVCIHFYIFYILHNLFGFVAIVYVDDELQHPVCCSLQSHQHCKKSITVPLAAGSASVQPLRGWLVSRYPANAFQHHVSMWYNNGKMNHWPQAHTHSHSLNPLLTPFGSRHVCKVLKSESGRQGDWSYWPQKWGLRTKSNKYRLLRHRKETCCCFSILSQVCLFFSFCSLKFLTRAFSTVSLRHQFTFDRFLCHPISLRPSWNDGCGHTIRKAEYAELKH